MTGVMPGRSYKCEGGKTTDMNGQVIECGVCGRPATSLMTTAEGQDQNRCWMHGPVGLGLILSQSSADLEIIRQEITRELRQRTDPGRTAG